jgi:hypothetical protein
MGSYENSKILIMEKKTLQNEDGVESIWSDNKDIKRGSILTIDIPKYNA